MTAITLNDVLKELDSLSDCEKVLIKKKKFGVSARNSLGIYHKDLKVISKRIGSNNALALELFDSGIYEARILCSQIYDPELITEEQMEKWVATFENWEICDSFCMGFFAKSKHALPKAIKWSSAENEFIKRAGFVIMASYGFANKHASNKTFAQFFPIIEQEATDERVYVKKAVNWALRNIGKRNIDLNTSAVLVANKLLSRDDKTAKWIANNALKELTSKNINMLDYPRAFYRA